MTPIFLSYRRADSQNITDRIYDGLVKEFCLANVFKDVDSIPLGADFRRVIEDSVTEAYVLLAVIGPSWVNATDEMGNRRLENPDDFVRIEIETALKHSITVVPITVDGASVPSASDLPEKMKAITSRQGLAIRPDPDFHNDIERLIHFISRHFGITVYGGFTEVLKHRAEFALQYIYDQREAALHDAAGGVFRRSRSSPFEIIRRYDKAIDNFKALHAKYLEAINANKPQLMHEILGQLYQLLYDCRYTRDELPPPPLLCDR